MKSLELHNKTEEEKVERKISNINTQIHTNMTDYLEHRNILRNNLQNLKLPANLRSSTTIQAPQPPNQLDEVDNNSFPRMDYRFESARLQSYTNWPLPYMDPAKLASAGFFYTGEGDNVQCFECGMAISQWAEGDNPMSDHQRWRSNCRFVLNQPCGNVPIGVDPSTVPLPLPRSRDVCGRYGEELRPGASPDFRTGQTEFQFSSEAKLASFGLVTPKGPLHSQYASYDARLRTFETWPKSMPQTKEQLADAGFYYTGNGDQTLCYHCGGGLKDWEPEDDPWTQHAKWFKKCYYVLMVKGQAFINSVTGQSMAPRTKEETLQMNLPSKIEKVEATASAGSAEKPNVELKPVCKSTDDARMCKICYNEELGVVFLPCGHMVACTRCAPGMTSCAVCREPIIKTVRAIIS